MPDSSRPGDKYTSRYLNSLSGPYRRRIESFLRRNPDANITQARGHRQSTSPRAQRSRLAPRERYTPEYLETLSPNWRRQIERELRISQEEEREFIMPGSLRSRALQRYRLHLRMLGIALDSIDTKTGVSFRQDFNNTWRLLPSTNARYSFIAFVNQSIVNTIHWKENHSHQPSIEETISNGGIIDGGEPVQIGGVVYDPETFLDYDFPSDYDLNEIDWHDILPPSVPYYHSI